MDKSGSGRLGSDSGEPTSSSPAGANGGVVPDTYKQLPDDDVNWQAKNNKTEDPKLKTMGKQNGTDGEDEAQEKMLKNDVKLSVVPSKDASEVKFIPENGDAKIDIETVKQSLSGMGKAELMKYANDPFWIKLRWFLFIAFWVLWIAMLCGAVAIIVMAPKCNAPEPKKWWEESPIVSLSSAEISSKGLNGLESFIDPLHQQHVKGLALQSILKENAPGHVKDFKAVNDKLGTMEDFKKLVKAAREKKINVILDIDPNHSSNEHPWFEKSVKREEPYTSYYVWSDGRKVGEEGLRQPPNNWVSVNGGSAWEYNEERKQYYLHQFNKSQPDLNYSNPAVINEFSDILLHWIKLGVNGFRLANTAYLVEDPNLMDDPQSPTFPVGEGTYESLLHYNTRNRNQNGIVLRQWRDVVLNTTEGESLFTLTDWIVPYALSSYNRQKTLVDIPQATTKEDVLSMITPATTATQLNSTFSEMLNNKDAPWQTIDLNGKYTSLRRRMNINEADSLTLMIMLLPGTPVLKMNDTQSAKEAFSILSRARQSPQFLYGDLDMHVLNNGTVFSYTRYGVKSGNPGYLVVYNTANQNTILDLTKVPGLSEEVNVVTHSPNYIEKLIDSKKMASNKVPLSPKSTLVVTFVPTKK